MDKLNTISLCEKYLKEELLKEKPDQRILKILLMKIGLKILPYSISIIKIGNEKVLSILIIIIGATEFIENLIKSELKVEDWLILFINQNLIKYESKRWPYLISYIVKNIGEEENFHNLQNFFELVQKYVSREQITTILRSSGFNSKKLRKMIFLLRKGGSEHGISPRDNEIIKHELDNEEIARKKLLESINMLSRGGTNQNKIKSMRIISKICQSETSRYLIISKIEKIISIISNLIKSKRKNLAKESIKLLSNLIMNLENSLDYYIETFSNPLFERINENQSLGIDSVLEMLHMHLTPICVVNYLLKSCQNINYSIRSKSIILLSRTLIKINSDDLLPRNTLNVISNILQDKPSARRAARACIHTLVKQNRYKILLSAILEPLKQISQGAEAIISRTILFNLESCSRKVIIKNRFEKSYRHPILDRRLTKSRTKSEARTIKKALKAGIKVPCIYFVNESIICMEDLGDKILKENISKENLIKLGKSIALLHNEDIIHGDLTTSNSIITNENELYLIDFGLSFISINIEDKAVDLYVLERAFHSTHSDSSFLFSQVLKSYSKNCKNSEKILKRLNKVRKRGRKKIVFG